jgi:hypothetical protein
VSVRDRSGSAPDDMVVARLHSLAPHLDGEPDPAFRAATRARLVAMAAVRTPAPEPVSRLRRLLTAADTVPSRWRTRLTAGLAGAAMTVTALATVVAVSTESGPGDALYGLKRGTEQTQLALAGDGRGETLLDLASTRLDEVRALVAEEANALSAADAPTGPAQVTVLAAGADPDLVVSTLAAMDQQTTEGAAWLAERAVTTQDGKPLDLLAGWAAEQSAELAALRPDMPTAADGAALDSLALLSDVRTRAGGLGSALDCAGGPATIGSDQLGPVPGLCLPDTTNGGAPGGGSPEGGVPGEVGGPGTGTPTDGPTVAVPENPSPSVPSPSVPSLGGTDPGLPGTGRPGGGLIPPLPSPPVTGNDLLPPPSLPGTGALPPTTISPPATTPKTPLDIDVCLPPLATLGDC